MKRILKQTFTSLAVAAALVTAPLAQATNGYFKIGYGTKNRGMAGAGMAYGQDALAPGVNPATLSGVGTRFDGGIEIFNPQRKAAVDSRGLGPTGINANAESGSRTFAIPNLGVSKEYGNGFTAGLAILANGGMNTRYNTNLFTNAFVPVIGVPSGFGGPSGFAGLLEGAGAPSADIEAVLLALGADPDFGPSLGINLSQLLITPTIAYQFSKNHSVGVSPIIAYQRFRAYGLGLFKGFSSDPGNVTNNGDDDAWGGGVRIGYQGKFGPVSFGVSAASKVYMQEFDDYAGLFAEQGDFDIPPNYGIGLAIEVSPKLTIAADVSRIIYSDVASISNKGPTADEFFNGFAAVLAGANTAGLPFSVAKPLGSDNGWGFGWDDATIYKIGVNYAYSPKWTFRGGFNYSEVPFDDDQSLFNVLAPAVVEKHITAGFTYVSGVNSEVSMTFMHAFRNDTDATYTGSAGTAFAGFNFGAENSMQQNAIEISYARKF